MMLKNFENYHKTFAKLPAFSNFTDSKPECPTSTKTESKKKGFYKTPRKVPSEFSDKVKILPGKGL